MLLRPLISALFMLLYCSMQAQGISGPQRICLGNPANFDYTPASGLSISSISWTFGDGGTANTGSVSHTYGASGKYRIRVQAVLSNSSTHNDSMDTEVFGLPVVQFRFDPDNDSCLSNNIICVRDSSAEAAPGQSLVSRLMVWGDGSFSNTANPKKGDRLCHNYAVADLFSLRMEITDNKGCRNSLTLNQNVLQTVNPQFVAVQIFSDCYRASVNIRNRSDGYPEDRRIHYLWTVDTSAADTQRHFTQLKKVFYGQSKTVHIKLKAWAETACPDSAEMDYALLIDSLPAYIALQDSVVCYSNDALNIASVPDVQRDAINWYIYGQFKELVADSQIFFDTRKTPGRYPIRVDIARGNCFHRLDTTILVKGPLARMSLMDNKQCYSNRDVFMVENTLGSRREDCRFEWRLQDPYGDTCTQQRIKDINKYSNCNRSLDWFNKHRYTRGSGDSLKVTLYVWDSISQCMDSTYDYVNTQYCSSLLDPDTIEVCQFKVFTELPQEPKPSLFSLDTGKTWLPYPYLLDTVYLGDYRPMYIFRTYLPEYGRHYGDDSLTLHRDTIIYADTVFANQIVRIHKGRTDNITYKIYGRCKPYRISLYFGNSAFKKGESLRVNWIDTLNTDIVFTRDSTIDSLFIVLNRSAFKTLVSVQTFNVHGCVNSSSYYVFRGKFLNCGTSSFINCKNSLVCFYPAVLDAGSNTFWNANTPRQYVEWQFPDSNKTIRRYDPCAGFSKGGMQPFRMMAYDSFGCADTLYDSVFIQDPVAGVKQASKIIYCSELKQFFDSSTFYRNPPWRRFLPFFYRDTIKRYSWQFGNGSFSSLGKNPVQAINVPLDSIPAAIAIETVSGCRDTFRFSLKTIGPKPYFRIRDSIGCASLKAEFIHLSRDCKSYVWEFGDNAGTSISRSALSDETFTYTIPGRYYIRLKGIDSVYNAFTGQTQYCSNTFPDKLFQPDTQRSVLVLPLLNTEIMGPDTACVNSLLVFVSINDSAYNTTYDADRWFSSDGATQDGSAPSVFLHRYTQTGIYNLSLKPYYNDPIKNRCRDSASKTIHILGVKADFDVDPASKAPLFRFVNKSQPLPADMYWDFGRPGPGNNSTETDAQKDYGTDTGSYTVCLVASIPYGCRDTVCKVVFNDYLSGFGIYNVFSPGLKDNLNDVYDVVIEGETVYELRIFNRWGQQVYYSDKDYDNSQPAAEGNWNGKLNNEGPDCPAGTYYYIFRYELKSKPGEMQTVQGAIRLMR